jgi:hypothetical protein
MAEIDKAKKLEPYKSLVLARIKKGTNRGSLIDRCLRDIKREEILDIPSENESADDSRERVRREKHSRSGINSSAVNLEHGFLHYELQKPVSWTSAGVYDTENHLVLFSRKKKVGLLALYASEKSKRRAIRRKFDNSDYDGLQYLSPVEPDQLNDAFFGDQVRTLWLSGMHRRVPVKADAKVLSGQDLEYALDPVNDQTFYFSAVRSSSVQGVDENKGDRENSDEDSTDDEDRDERNQPRELQTVGLSPKKSRIWTRPSRSWGEYLEGTDAILTKLSKILNSEEEDGDDELLPVLADVASGESEIGPPYDMVIQPPELLTSEVEQEEDEHRKNEEWAYNAHFEIMEETELGDDFDLIDDTTPPNMVSEVYHRGDKIGKVAIELDASDQRNVQIETVEAVPDDEEDEEQESRFKTLKKLCRSTRKLKVYYDSGHTLSGGSLYRVQFQTRPFDQFLWASFKDEYDITKEKPSNFPTGGDKVEWDDPSNAEGDEKYSLFHWVCKKWPADPDSWKSSDVPREWEDEEETQGWLAIDDGSMEIADFIHYRVPEDGKPVLSLIHVKGSGNDSNNRQISVANHEVVTGQAIKNLRHLEATNLAEKLRPDGEEKKVDSFVWKDGSLATVDDSDSADTRRGKMANVLESQDADFQRRVVILQPHIRRSYYEDTRDSDDGQNKMRLHQLDVLLNGARQSCNGLGAEFWVIAADARVDE